MNEDTIHKVRIIQLPEGELKIDGKTGRQDLDQLAINLNLKAFRPAKRQKMALLEIADDEKSKVVTAQLGGEIVGYVTFHPPDEFERWSAGPKQVLELGAIEVAPCVRQYGIAKKMLEAAFADPAMEDYIVLSTEYYWHWDLDGSGLHVWEYREVMRKVMEHVGLAVVDTDEEEILSHAANMLMVRYGKNVPAGAVSAFEALLFME